MLALKSGVMAGDAVVQALLAQRFFARARFENTDVTLREGVENMRKLVYAFYDPNSVFDH